MSSKAILVICLLGLASTGLHGEDKVYFGNLHSHTSYSDGSGVPREAYRHARHAAKLDFLAVTEHNHAAAEDGASLDRKDGVLIGKTPALYEGPDPESLIPVALESTVDGTFVSLYGQEFSSINKGNHAIVLDVDKVITVTNGRFDALVRNWLPSHLDSTGKKAIIQFNHPKLYNGPGEYGADDFGTPEQWLKEMGEVACLIEILNGPAMTKGAGEKPEEVMEEDFLDYLNKGFHLAPTADQDNHYFTWGTATNARTGVIADSLTRASLLEGLRKRHVYATEDKNLRVIVRVNGQLCGDIISPPPAVDSELDIQVSVVDDDEPEAGYLVDVFSDTIGGSSHAKVIDTISVDGNTPTGTTVKIEDIKYTGGFQYLFFRIRQLHEDNQVDRVWTAPIWLEPAAGNPNPAEAADTANFVASKRSTLYHISPLCKDAMRIKPQNRVTGANAAIGRQLHPNCPREE